MGVNVGFVFNLIVIVLFGVLAHLTSQFRSQFNTENSFLKFSVSFLIRGDVWSGLPSQNPRDNCQEFKLQKKVIIK